MLKLIPICNQCVDEIPRLCRVGKNTNPNNAKTAGEIPMKVRVP